MVTPESRLRKRERALSMTVPARSPPNLPISMTMSGGWVGERAGTGLLKPTRVHFSDRFSKPLLNRRGRTSLLMQRIDFEVSAVATLRKRVTEVEEINEDLIAFARGHAGAVSSI